MDDYIKKELLGEGGFGKVHKVQCKADGVKYTIIFYVEIFCKENS